MAAVRHLGFLKYATFYIPHGMRSLSACSCKISSRSDELLLSYCKFSISKMAAVRHLEFLKYANFYLPHGLWSLSAFSCKISSQSDERLPRYCKFSISKMAAVRHLAFLKHANFNLPIVCDPNLHAFAKYRRDRMKGSELLQVFDFQYGGRPPSWILKICKFSPSLVYSVSNECG